ncbi:MAG: Exodeoxyribonuclease 8 [Planctomycetota bacterium]
MTSDYYANRALSHSKLSCLAQNPMEFRMRYVDDPPTLPPKESDAFAMGHAVHCLALEPEKFDDRFVVVEKVLSANSTAGQIAAWFLDNGNEGKVIPYVSKPEEINRRTNLGKTQWANFQEDCKRNGFLIVDQESIDIGSEYARLTRGKIVLDDQDVVDAIACVQALNNHAEFATIMAQPKRVEVPFEFDLFGHRFKAKPDAIIDSMKLIVDIKTTDDASPHRWQWSAVDYGYHRQAYIYQQAVQLETNEWYRFVFAVVEKPKPSTRGIPPTVALYELDIETVMMGREDVLTLATDYETRLETNNWQQPYSSGIVPLRLPKRRVYSEE